MLTQLNWKRLYVKCTASQNLNPRFIFRNDWMDSIWFWSHQVFEMCLSFICLLYSSFRTSVSYYSWKCTENIIPLKTICTKEKTSIINHTVIRITFVSTSNIIVSLWMFGFFEQNIPEMHTCFCKKSSGRWSGGRKILTRWIYHMSGDV